jgi:hypothetical protein
MKREDKCYFCGEFCKIQFKIIGGKEPQACSECYRRIFYNVDSNEWEEACSEVIDGITYAYNWEEIWDEVD